MSENIFVRLVTQDHKSFRGFEVSGYDSVDELKDLIESGIRKCVRCGKWGCDCGDE